MEPVIRVTFGSHNHDAMSERDVIIDDIIQGVAGAKMITKSTANDQ